MRNLIAASMLLLQFQPVLGLALCDLISGADRGRMEAGCPMPDAGENTEHSGIPGVSGVGGDQGCVLAEACGPRPPAVLAASDALVSTTTDLHRLVAPADPTIPTTFMSPPVPPPRPTA